MRVPLGVPFRVPLRPRLGFLEGFLQGFLQGFQTVEGVDLVCCMVWGVRSDFMVEPFLNS